MIRPAALQRAAPATGYDGGMTTQIRQAQRGDIAELAELWARAFQGERTVGQRIEQLESGGVFGGLETAWLAGGGGRAVGAYRAYALHQHMHGAVCRMMGLAAVAVDEAARRRGIGRELCLHAIRTARERGDVYSVLYPFRPAFYEALGWGMTGTLHTYRFRPESLRARGGTKVRRAVPRDAPAIAACYERFAAGANGPLRRTQRVWRSHFDGDGVHVFVTGADGISGYVIVRFGRASSPDDKPMYVRELIADDHGSYEELLGWLSAQRDSWRVIQYDASPDERFSHRLTEPRPPGFHLTRNAWAPVARVIRGPMLRILDVKSALEARLRWGPAAPLRFGLEVRDAQVPENDGSFVIDFDGGAAAVARGSARPLLRLSAAVLAQVFAGELRVTEALMLGLAEAEGDVGTVDGLLRVDRCFRLLDEF
jgi:predicted acetyltransferase